LSLQNDHLHRLLKSCCKLAWLSQLEALIQQVILNFCKVAKIRPIPALECALRLFTTHLAMSDISYGTIKVYLSAIRHMHICKGMHAHFRQQMTPCLHLILRGSKKHQAGIHLIRKRLPITIQLRNLLAKKSSYDNTTLWAMCSLAFFWFLRVSKFTIPRADSYDPSCHLSFQDIAVDSRTKPRIMQVFLKQSKTDPFKQGVFQSHGYTICPVKVLLSYMAKRNFHPGPLFITKEGKGWTKSMFHVDLQHLLENLKLNKSTKTPTAFA